MSAPDQLADAKAELQILSGQIWPRRGLLLKSRVVWVSLFLALITLTGCLFFPVARARIDEIAGIGLSYASISAGVCITALTFSLALPGEERLRRWAQMKGTRGDNSSALGDLVFALFWAALSQVLLILYCVGALVVGYHLPLLPPDFLLSHLIALGAGFWIFFYALLELIVVLQTLVQIAVVFVFEERNGT